MEVSARPLHLAVIDVGTNAIRLVVAEIEGDAAYRVLASVREQTRLGDGLDETGRIGEAAMNRSVAVLGSMKAISDEYRVDKLRVIATSAVREAENGAKLVEAARVQHGVAIEVISAAEEARLALRSVETRFPLDGSDAAIVDIGGGTVEVVLVAEGKIGLVRSLPLGAVRLTEACLRSDPIPEEEWKALLGWIRREIREQLGQPSHTAATMIGSGGTFTALAAMVAAERGEEPPSPHGYVLSRSDLVHMRDRLRKAPLGDRRQIRGLSPERADIIVAGVAVVERLARHLDAERILVNEKGIRDGLLLEMVARFRGVSTGFGGPGADSANPV